jgi:hypothetical protein
MQRKEIRENWSRHRCDLGVMPLAFLFNTDPTKSNMEFASENFTFCMREYTRTMMGTVMAPVTAMLKPVSEAAHGSIGYINSLRKLLATLQGGIQAMFDVFARRFAGTMLEFKMVLHQVETAMSRAQAALLNIFFAGVSMVVTMLNLFDIALVIAGVMLAIMYALMFWFYSILWPVIWLITGTAAAVGVAAASSSSAYCFPPNVMVAMQGGGRKAMDALCMGDVVAGGGIVTALFRFNGSQVPMWSYTGIPVSGNHIVYELGRWNNVSHCRFSTPIDARYPLLCCANTSDGILPILRDPHDTDSQVILFRDYEELTGLGDQVAFEWDYLVRRTLNRTAVRMADELCAETGFPCRTLVTTWHGPKRIGEVAIGEMVEDDYGLWTTVTGVMRIGSQDIDWCRIGDCILSRSQLICTGADEWIRAETHPGCTPIEKGLDMDLHTDAFHLFTSNGSFRVQGCQVRDYAECELAQEETNRSILAFLNMLPSVQEHVAGFHQRRLPPAEAQAAQAAQAVQTVPILELEGLEEVLQEQAQEQLQLQEQKRQKEQEEREEQEKQEKQKKPQAIVKPLIVLAPSVSTDSWTDTDSGSVVSALVEEGDDDAFARILAELTNLGAAYTELLGHPDAE